MSQAGKYASGGNTPPIESLTGNTGGPVSPDSNFNTNIIGAGDITVTGNPGTHTLTITTSGVIADSFPTDSGTATPAAGVLNVLGGTAGRNINTSGSGNTIHIDMDNAIFLGDLSNITGSNAIDVLTGDITLRAGSLKMANSTSSGLIGFIEYNGLEFIHNFGDRCAWIGEEAGNFPVSTNADDNNGHGFQTLGALTTGDKNNGVGNFAGGLVTSGENNNFFGYQAGENLLTGFNNVIIGHQSGATYTTVESSNILVSNLGVILDTHTTRIGTSGSGIGQQNKCYIAGIDTVNVGSVAKVVTMASDQLGTATITAGTGITVTPTANTITIAASGTSTLTYTNVTTTPYVVLSTDEYISVDSSGGVRTIQLPNSATSGRTYIVKDRTGSAATNNITVTTVGGAVNIDAATTFVMNTAYQSVNIIGNGSTYEVF